MAIKEILATDKTATATTGSEKVRSIITSLANNFVFSMQANFRKGGLVGLAAVAVALADNCRQYLEVLLPPIFKCLQDQEPRVRYYACEALYNISKVSRGAVLTFFNEIFDGLFRVFCDTDIDVKNGASLLDRLLKDIVTEADKFQPANFIPLLNERIKSREPFARQLLVSWIGVLDSVPDIDMLQFLPSYLGGVFEMLSDPNKDIRQQAYGTLMEFLGEIKQDPSKADLGAMIPLVVERCFSPDSFTRLTALNWVFEFVGLGQKLMLPFTAIILESVLQCIADPEDEIRQKAEATNVVLLQLAEKTEEKIDMESMLSKLSIQLSNASVATRLASLKWINMLLTKLPHLMIHYLGQVFPSLLQSLSDADEQVVRISIEVLARMALQESQFAVVLARLFQLFDANRKLLESRGSLIIRQLCVLLDGESIFRSFAIILCDHKDLEFASLFVQNLNIILLTSAELFDLRNSLKSSLSTQGGRDLFLTLFKSWSHNPVAAFSLCLLAQCYELASALAFAMADIEVTVGFLMQIDKLVQLIESPIFIHIRLQLLDPRLHPFLLKALYGLLMLLPQSTAFTSLKARLECASQLGVLNAIPDSKFVKSVNPLKDFKESSQFNFASLLEHFRSLQAAHSAHRKQVFLEHSLKAGRVKEERKDDK